MAYYYLWRAFCLFVGRLVQLFICGSSSRPLEQIYSNFSMSVVNLWVEPSALLDCFIGRLNIFYISCKIAGNTAFQKGKFFFIICFS